jgi:hypothetical protein
LQCDRLAGAGCTRDQAVPVAAAEEQALRLAAAQANENRRTVVHAITPKTNLPHLFPEQGRRGKRDQEL